MKRGTLTHCQPSGKWFDELLIHDPEGDWEWFWKGYKSVTKFVTRWECNQNFTFFRKENRDELSKRLGEAKYPRNRPCRTCFLEHCICDTLDRI